MLWLLSFVCVVGAVFLALDILGVVAVLAVVAADSVVVNAIFGG